MHACVLSSGSKGNALWVESPAGALLVDCGLSVPELSRRLSAVGRSIESLRGIVVTHDHGDHVGSSVALAKRRGIPLHATAGTHSILKALPEQFRKVVRAGDAFEIADFTVRPFATPHDGIESIGVRVDHAASGRSLGLATDLGYVSRTVVDSLAGVHFAVVEHNHDPQMLEEGPYPIALKKRIRGGFGHLTNEQGAQLAGHLAAAGVRRIVLAHLSETNNTPDAARKAFERFNRDLPAHIRVEVAAQHVPGPLVEV